MILTTAVAVVVVAGGYWMLGGPEGKYGRFRNGNRNER